jgi:hypothetical protein
VPRLVGAQGERLAGEQRLKPPEFENRQALLQPQRYRKALK